MQTISKATHKSDVSQKRNNDDEDDEIDFNEI